MRACSGGGGGCMGAWAGKEDIRRGGPARRRWCSEHLLRSPVREFRLNLPSCFITLMKIIYSDKIPNEE